eukprot:1160141-Pelagomonas_calceolata.AAC.5
MRYQDRRSAPCGAYIIQYSCNIRFTCSLQGQRKQCPLLTKATPSSTRTEQQQIKQLRHSPKGSRSLESRTEQRLSLNLQTH